MLKGTGVIDVGDLIVCRCFSPFPEFWLSTHEISHGVIGSFIVIDSAFVMDTMTIKTHKGFLGINSDDECVLIRHEIQEKH